MQNKKNLQEEQNILTYHLIYWIRINPNKNRSHQNKTQKNK